MGTGVALVVRHGTIMNNSSSSPESSHSCAPSCGGSGRREVTVAVVVLVAVMKVYDVDRRRLHCNRCSDWLALLKKP